ncbi:dipeptidyl aminopeptidase/acylaminoacyl peptidase [Neolewinella xylanilytica]|uniref:Dipeptidyl aminopeptidase/acylaminoacyl peptidase n=1 Tax=Neolewinella xylanilytica TaxID=1514080 RepID=A0A2S6I451_9BACT|nr:prolyl oligopeptidase family serine peptidase [Neolewinella xylanilytica]PPK85956.1 dipeptidyl aminopeptidase/acylaminoacyl peptidase [Neolewinella xylanilytica]
MKTSTLCLFLALYCSCVHAQLNLDYQQPPEEILELVDVPLAPTVLMDHEREHMVLLYRDAYKTIADLSETELRLGGLRIDPKRNIGSRTNYYNDVKVRSVAAAPGTEQALSGLPENPRLSNITWSPDQRLIAMTHTADDGVELWLADVATATARKLTGPTVNANMRDVINWDEDGRSLLVKMLPDDREPLIDVASAVPTGPTISVADGEKAQNRTYQDLLSNPNDEFNFEQLARAVVHRVDLDGNATEFLPAAMYDGVSFSPDGEYVMVETIERPFSYIVPYSRFPTTTTVYTRGGDPVQTVAELPLIEVLPQGFMSTTTERRSIQWRADRPATLVYVRALDGGDPEREAAYRDEVFQLEAPFSGEGESLLKTTNRYAGILWGDDDVAVAYDRWFDTRNMKVYAFDPSEGDAAPRVLFDLNYQDNYSDPGNFVTTRNEYGSEVLALDDAVAYLIGDGYTPEGQFPFLNEIDLESGETENLYTSAYNDKLEELSDYDPESERLLVRIESPIEYPNYYFRNLDADELQQLTAFNNPFQSLQDVHKEVITYQRDDGLELNGTLYLPVGYDRQTKEKVPLILWAYPREFKDKASAAQSTSNPNAFTYPYYGSPIYWVTRGYAVLDDAAFPIVGEGDEEPNDSFREQLVANAKAAIDAVDEMGYIDRDRVAVGGHSYGAFMVANLLSHSDLFAAGIARSGAYNRTLTPFGFQSEQRNYWEAPDVYNTMSPFMHAEKMKTPLLLIHGEADNNSGTYPLQSERYFNALKGLGATVRLVMLPKESHGYRAKESILHLLWEQDRWLEEHVKNKEPMR